MLRLNYRVKGRGDNVMEFISLFQGIQAHYSNEIMLDCNFISSSACRALVCLKFYNICPNYEIIIETDQDITDIQANLYKNCNRLDLIIDDRLLTYGIDNTRHIELMETIEKGFSEYDRNPNNRVRSSNRSYKNDKMNTITITLDRGPVYKPVLGKSQFWIGEDGISVLCNKSDIGMEWT